MILFLGICLVAITGVDLSNISATHTQSEQSIWPSSGRGLWIGLFVTAVGIFTILAVREQTHDAFYILLPYTIVAIVLTLFGLLTSITVLERYLKDPDLSDKENRSKEQAIQFALAGLLVGIFAVTFLFLSCLSCLICWTVPNVCRKFQGRHPQPISLYFPNEYPLRPVGTPAQERLIPRTPLNLRTPQFYGRRNLQQ